MTSFVYPAKIEQDADGFFLVTFRDFPFAATDARTMAEAMDEATDCLEEAVASCIEDGETVPMPSKLLKEEILIMLPSLMSAKAALHNAVEEDGVKKTALAKFLDVSEKEGRRWLDPRHKTKIATLEKALGALGRKLVVGVEKEPAKEMSICRITNRELYSIKQTVSKKTTKVRTVKAKAGSRTKKSI